MDHFTILLLHVVSERLKLFLVHCIRIYFVTGMWKIWSTAWITTLSCCSYLLVQSISHYCNYDTFSCNLLPEQFFPSILTAINGETWPLRSSQTIDELWKVGTVPTQTTNLSYFCRKGNLTNTSLSEVWLIQPERNFCLLSYYYLYQLCMEICINCSLYVFYIWNSENGGKSRRLFDVNSRSECFMSGSTE